MPMKEASLKYLYKTNQFKRYLLLTLKCSTARMCLLTSQTCSCINTKFNKTTLLLRWKLSRPNSNVCSILVMDLDLNNNKGTHNNLASSRVLHSYSKSRWMTEFRCVTWLCSLSSKHICVELVHQVPISHAVYLKARSTRCSTDF